MIKNASYTGMDYTELWRGHVHDALARVVDAEMPDARCVCVARELLDHVAHLGIRDPGCAPVAIHGRHVMICEAECLLGPPHGSAFALQRVKGVKRALVHEEAVHKEQLPAVLCGMDQVPLPNLFEQGAWNVHGLTQVRCRAPERGGPMSQAHFRSLDNDGP